MEFQYYFCLFNWPLIDRNLFLTPSLVNFHLNLFFSRSCISLHDLLVRWRRH